jgi:hypothetical protein
MTMRVKLLSLALVAKMTMAWPIAGGYAQTTVSEGELFLGGSRLWGTAAVARILCSAGECAVVSMPEIRNRYRNDGWEASITGNFNRFAGIELNVACCQKPRSGNGPQYTFLFGPHFAYRGNARVQPFAHVLLGLAHGRQPAPYFHSTWRPGFAAGFGGGLDVKAMRFLWVRAIQADYLRESFRDDVQKNGRLSFGIVFRFGKPVSF